MKKTIYKITCLENGKIYIGQTCRDINIRLTEHSYNSGYVSLLTRAIKKYGKDKFKIEEIYYGEDYNNQEKLYIEQYDTRNPLKGYNIGVGGEEPPTFYGDDNSLAVFNHEWFLQTVDLIKNSKKEFQEIAIIQNCHKSTVSRINLGQLRKEPDWKYPLRMTKLTRYEIEGIQWFLINTKLHREELTEMFGCSISSIKAIRNGQNHFNENYSYPLGGSDIRLGLKQKIKNLKDQLIESNLSANEIANKNKISLFRLDLINKGVIYFEEDELYPIRK